uniref:Putative secreted protein n=1 Tax=Ixodes ricinus TaxID=34613 RepID=A0A6B0UIV8_IXORI
MTSVLVSLFWLYLGSSADSFLLSLNHIISRPGFSVELHWSTSDLDRGSRRIPLPGISSLVWTAFTRSRTTVVATGGSVVAGGGDPSAPAPTTQSSNTAPSVGGTMMTCG